MSKKDLLTKLQPKDPPSNEDIDAFVNGGVGKDTETQKSVSDEIRTAVKMARLTVDLPDDAHLAFKLACTKARTKMNEELRIFIYRRTQELEQTAG